MQNTYSPLPPRKGKKDEMFPVSLEEDVRALSHLHGRFAGWLNAREGAVRWQLVSWERAGETWGCFLGAPCGHQPDCVSPPGGTRLVRGSVGVVSSREWGKHSGAGGPLERLGSQQAPAAIPFRWL